jgi:heme/copper-type cytochrome/quinol oxidase subunit 3
MLVFLAAETMLFAGFIAAFLIFRLGGPVWPPPFQPRLPLGMTGLNTLVLLASSLTMRAAIRAGRRADRRGFVLGLAVTIALGTGFVALQGSEWARLLAFGLTPASGVYGGLFYVLIGAHATHVLGALGWLAGLGARAVAERVQASVVAHAAVFALYWHFLVALWPVLYVLVYLV